LRPHDHCRGRRQDPFVTDAVERGAKVLLGGHPLPGPGYFYAPTVLTDVPADAAIAHEEIFGPVAPLFRFSDIDKMMTAANETEYGLVGYIYTTDLKRGFDLAGRLESGMIALNRGLVSDPAAPFGGMKQSGLGREGGVHGVLEFMEAKYIATNF
jgi:succinate-semialdehyde dehydrogenase/glutarate-semialdehyde dehydrogenase